MIIYIEKQALAYEQSKIILKKFSSATIIEIDNFKNIFSKDLGANFPKNDMLVIAKLKTEAILDAPDGYGHNDKTSYFLKTSLNCIFDCSYCFLKGAFKNDIPVYFVNYDDIKTEILDKINTSPQHLSTTSPQPSPTGEGVEPFGTDDVEQDFELKFKQDISYKDKIWFYSSDYSDILGMNYISGFLQNFVPFFEQLDNCMMEIRTKSANIKDILDLGFVPKNTEFAFSLNPQVLIDRYEKNTSSLDDRILAINTLIGKGYKVGIRFLPLLPVENYKEIYSEFVSEIKQKIDFKKVSSTFVSGLLYTKSDYKNILKKYPKLDILYRLQEEKDGFVRESREQRTFFYELFSSLDKSCFICLDTK